MPQILLAAKDWKARVLLRAQLIEEGFDVEAHETASDALEGLETRWRLPALFIADLSASDDPALELEHLATWSRRLPTWIITSRSLGSRTAFEGRGFDRVLFRPVDLGQLVEQIKQRLASVG